MPNNHPQTFANHVKRDPLFIFVLLLLLTLFVLTLVQSFRIPGLLSISLFMLSTAALVLAFLTRTYSLKVQDRVIRLEEQLRMARLLPNDLLQRTSYLTPSQFIALRFASDAELHSLVAQALDGNLSGVQIKQRIVDWRPDHHRV